MSHCLKKAWKQFLYFRAYNIYVSLLQKSDSFVKNHWYETPHKNTVLCPHIIILHVY